jgi:lactoylglutathione lyase
LLFNCSRERPQGARQHYLASERGSMKFRFDHNNINVRDLEKSLHFYTLALGLTEMRRFEPPDKSFILVFLGDGTTTHKIELTWLRDRTAPYNLGDNEFHLALVVDDYEAAYKHHKEMGVVCYENPVMGIYFIEDPDGYWVEIVPERK